MEVIFQIETDIQIPDHLYNEAAELFQDHLRKYYEEQLLKGDSSLLISQGLDQKRNTRKIHLVQLDHLGQSCPLYCKKHKGLGSAVQPCQSQV